MPHTFNQYLGEGSNWNLNGLKLTNKTQWQRNRLTITKYIYQANDGHTQKTEPCLKIQIDIIFKRNIYQYLWLHTHTYVNILLLMIPVIQLAKYVSMYYLHWKSINIVNIYNYTQVIPSHHWHYTHTRIVHADSMFVAL